MKLVVGSRGNNRSTHAIINGTKGRIAEVYLSVSNSKYGSGRNYVHEVDFDDISRQVAYGRKHGVKFSLAFNTVCLGRKKLTASFRDEFRQLLRKCERSGVTGIILSDPFLMEIAKDEFPGLTIIVSVFAEADSLNRLEFYNDLGVDRMIIPHELNRDLKKLDVFAKASRCDLEVILNLGCNHYCARGDAHSVYTGHWRQGMQGKVLGDYYTAYCNYRKLNRPWEVLSQDWIRPEDIYRYENIGIEYFKVAGRATSTAWIINTANAYLDRSYEGSLLDLISSYYPFTDRMPGDKSPLPALPNKKLDEVMERLYKCGHHCDHCDTCRKMYDKLIETAVH